MATVSRFLCGHGWACFVLWLRREKPRRVFLCLPACLRASACRIIRRRAKKKGECPIFRPFFPVCAKLSLAPPLVCVGCFVAAPVQQVCYASEQEELGTGYLPPSHPSSDTPDNSSSPTDVWVDHPYLCCRKLRGTYRLYVQIETCVEGRHRHCPFLLFPPRLTPHLPSPPPSPSPISISISISISIAHVHLHRPSPCPYPYPYPYPSPISISIAHLHVHINIHIHIHRPSPSPSPSLISIISSLQVRRRVGHGDGPLLHGRAADGAVQAVRRRNGGLFVSAPHVHRPLQPLDARAEVWGENSTLRTYIRIHIYVDGLFKNDPRGEGVTRLLRCAGA